MIKKAKCDSLPVYLGISSEDDYFFIITAALYFYSVIIAGTSFHPGGINDGLGSH